MSKAQLSESVVAIDLGSNSFHLLEAGVNDLGGMQIMTALAQKVQLGLDMTNGELQTDAIERGLACIKDFAAYTQGRSQQQVRIVGTQALRLASNRAEFIDPASQLLGQQVEIVSGEEEAMLAYRGVMSGLDATTSQTTLVVDIGGGSTELAVGCGERIVSVSSAPVGCVASLVYFPDGAISAQSLSKAQSAAAQQFKMLAGDIDDQWQLAIGCSGTLLAVEQVLIQQGWSSGGISLQGLEHLRAALLNFEHIEQVSFQGLKEGRRSIFASGAAIVHGLFQAFDLRFMSLSPTGLREGIAWQLLKQ